MTCQHAHWVLVIAFYTQYYSSVFVLCVCVLTKKVLNETEIADDEQIHGRIRFSSSFCVLANTCESTYQCRLSTLNKYCLRLPELLPFAKT